MPPKNLDMIPPVTVRVLRYFRIVLYLALIGMLWWLFTNFEFVRLEPGDASVTGVSGLRRLLVERTSADQPFDRQEIVVFAILDEENRQIYRASRLIALPGDRVASGNGVYTVNGEETGIRIDSTRQLEGTLPPGRFMVVNDHPHSEFADSLRLGWIPRECIIGRFLAELPF